jgi:hypothetical protein
MTFNIKVGGAWKEATPSVKVGGAWKTVSGAWVKVSGVWKRFYEPSSGVDPITITGSLSRVGTTVTIDGPVQQVEVPVGNSGNIEFRNLEDSLGTMSYFKDGVGPTVVLDGGIVTFSDMDDIQIRGSNLAVGEFVSVDLYDADSNTLIQSVTITR